MTKQTTEPSVDDERRQAFVQALYRMNAALGGNTHAAAQARRQLAILRRGFVGPRQEIQAYGIVFPFDPPHEEQEVWLLLAELFALHPQANTAQGRTVGGAMRVMAASRGEAVQRRLEQLLSVDQGALPHYLRQAMSLLRSGDVGLDYHQLLSDLLVLLRRDASDSRAHTVRLRWARDFHRKERDSTTSPDDSSEIVTV